MAEDSGDTSLAAGAADNSQEADQGNQSAPVAAEGGLQFDLPAEDRTKLARFKSHNDLGKSYLELERKLGASITLPGKNSTAEEREAFHKRLGRPDSPDGYELDSFFLPDGVTKADMGEEKFKAQAYELGLSKDQAKALHKWAVDASLEQAKQMKQQQALKKRDASEALRKEHGLEYEKKLALVGLVNQRFGGDEWIQFLNEGPGDDPRLLRVLMKVGEAISEDTLVQGRPAGMEPGEREDGLLSYPNRPEITGNRFRSVR
jgi:hypothetical protein